MYYFGRCPSELAQLIPIPSSIHYRSIRFSDRLYDFSVTIPRCYKYVYLNSFFPCTARFWNSLPTESFPLTYDLQTHTTDYRPMINRHPLTVGSF